MLHDHQSLAERNQGVHNKALSQGVLRRQHQKGDHLHQGQNHPEEDQGHPKEGRFHQDHHEEGLYQGGQGHQGKDQFHPEGQDHLEVVEDQFLHGDEPRPIGTGHQSGGDFLPVAEVGQGVDLEDALHCDQGGGKIQQNEHIYIFCSVIVM